MIYHLCLQNIAYQHKETRFTLIVNQFNSNWL